MLILKRNLYQSGYVPIHYGIFPVLGNIIIVHLEIDICLYHFRKNSLKKLDIKTLSLKRNLYQSGYVPIHYGIFPVLGNIVIVHLEIDIRLYHFRKNSLKN